MPEPRGVSAADAARQLQLAAGVVAPEARMRPAHEQPDEDLILRSLHEHGIDARAVKIEDGDLRWLRTPAALRLDDGTWLVFRRLRRLGRRSLEARCGGMAIEVTPPLDLAHPLRFAAAHAGALAGISAMALLLQLLAAAVPLLTRVVVDTALPHGAASILSVVALALALTAFFAGATSWLRGIALVQLRAVFDVASGRAFLQHFFRLPFADVQRRGVGESMQAMSGLQIARDLVLERAVRALLDLLGMLAYGAMLAFLFPSGALVVAAASLVVVVAACVVGARQARLQSDELTYQVRQRSFLYEAIAGIGTVKASGAEERTSQRWSELFTSEALTALRRMRAALGLEIATDVVRNAAVAVLLVWGGIQAMKGNLTPGSVVAMLQLATALLAAVGGAAGVIVAVLTTRQHLARTLDVVRTTVAPPRHAVRTGTTAARVVLDDVWFRHEARGKWVVQGRTLVVEPGAIHHLGGPSGSGKTTLLRLIAGLYVPERGMVRVGGEEPGRAGAFVYLPQFPHLFGGTIGDNLRIFSCGAALRERLDAAARTGLHDWVQSLPMRYETRVSTGGLNFSGGQRQLITLTAVLASDRQLLLLDEPMANLDASSRARIWRCLVRAGRTIIHASHDSLARYATAT